MERKDKKTIVFLTDFGDSHYAGILHGVVLKYNSEVNIVDLTHNITPFSVVEGSYILKTSYRYFPEHSIFVCVIDPGVGTERDILITQYENYTFVAPDNGLLSPFLTEGKTYKFTDFKRFEGVSRTFHGRDIFAPIGAILSRGEPPEVLGVTKENPLIIEWWKPQIIDKSTYQGIVLHIDRFGNVITNIPCNLINRILEIRIKGIIVKDKYATFSHAPYDTPFLYCGSSGFVEIGIRESNFSKKYDISLLSPLLCTAV